MEDCTEAHDVRVHNTWLACLLHFFPDKKALVPRTPSDNHNATHLTAMIAEATFNYSGSSWPRLTQSTHQPVADSDRWSLVIPSETLKNDNKSRDNDLIPLKSINPTSATPPGQAYGRPKQDLNGWVNRKLDDEGWRELIKQNFWDQKVKARIAEIVGMNDAWTRLMINSPIKTRGRSIGIKMETSMFIRRIGYSSRCSGSVHQNCHFVSVSWKARGER